MLRRPVCALLVAACGFSYGCVGTSHAAGSLVTKKHIRAVRIGMSQNELEQTLGAPISVQIYSDDHRELTYTRWPTGARYYPMLWVHMTGNRVIEVYAKRYGWWLIDDDIGIYGRGPVNFERPEFEELFPD